MTNKIINALLAVVSFATLQVMAADYTTDRETTNNRSTMDAGHPKVVHAENAPYVGFMGGVATPEGRYNSGGEYGLELGYKPFNPIGTAIEISHTDLKNTQTTSNLARTDVLFKATYSIGGTIPVIRDSYVGVGLGPIFKPDGTGFGSAPLLGFDIPLAANRDDANFSLGANAKFLIVSGSDPNALSVNGVLKYWY